MNLRFAWSTFGSDGGCCVESVQSVLDHGISPADCFVYVQRGKPLKKEDQDSFLSLGVQLREGRYTRRDTFSDVIAKFRSVVETGGDIVWNIDSDVIINDITAAREVLEGGYVAGAVHWNPCTFSGCSTLVRPDAASLCLKDLLEKNTPKLPATDTPDDVMMGITLDCLFGKEKVLRWDAKALGWYKFERNWKDMGEYRWVHFGQKKLARNFACGRPVRAAIAEHMKDFREWKKTTVS